MSGTDDVMGFLATPLGQGLLSAGFGGLAGARRGRPINTLGAAGLSGLLGYNKAQDNSYDKQLREMQMSRYGLEQKKYADEQGILANRKTALAKLGTQKSFAPTVENDQNPQMYTPQDIGQMLLSSGDLEGYGALQKAAPKFAREKNDKGEIVYIPEQPGQGQVMPSGVKAYNEALDPDVLQSRLKYDLSKTQQDQPYAIQRAAAGATHIENYPSPIAVTGPDGKQKMVRFGNHGDVMETPYTPPASNKPPTESQAKSATFLGQMRSASKEVERIQREGFSPDNFTNQVDTKLAGGTTNPLASASAQEYRQAQEQWTESFLRIKTGAAATQDEVIRNVRTFYPQPGDSGTVIKQKARMRAQAELDVENMTRDGASTKPSTSTPSGGAKFLGFE